MSKNAPPYGPFFILLLLLWGFSPAVHGQDISTIADKLVLIEPAYFEPFYGRVVDISDNEIHIVSGGYNKKYKFEELEITTLERLGISPQKLSSNQRSGLDLTRARLLEETSHQQFLIRHTEAYNYYRGLYAYPTHSNFVSSRILIDSPAYFYGNGPVYFYGQPSHYHYGNRHSGYFQTNFKAFGSRTWIHINF